MSAIERPTYFIGTSGWSYPDWKGKFYPEKLSTSKWLDYYQTKFSIVELNATFYRFFRESTFIKWREKAGKNFRYIIKVPKLITHMKRLKNCNQPINKFCELTNLLEDKLALILLQLPPSLALDINLLKNALECFDDPKKVVVEFRNKTWIKEETKELLQEMGSIFCIAESPNMSLTPWVTSRTAYIRLHGRKKWFDYNYTKQELKQISVFTQKLSTQGAKNIYILFNNDYFSYATQNALMMNSLLKRGPPRS